jgi:hypothetical protein
MPTASINMGPDKLDVVVVFKKCFHHFLNTTFSEYLDSYQFNKNFILTTQGCGTDDQKSKDKPLDSNTASNSHGGRL